MYKHFHVHNLVSASSSSSSTYLVTFCGRLASAPQFHCRVYVFSSWGDWHVRWRPWLFVVALPAPSPPLLCTLLLRFAFGFAFFGRTDSKNKKKRREFHLVFHELFVVLSHRDFFAWLKRLFCLSCIFLALFFVFFFKCNSWTFLLLLLNAA